MVEAMDVDDGALKQEAAAANGAPENDSLLAAESAMMSADKVTLLQASVDKMALSMFNALRLLPATLADDKTREENVAAIKQLAKDVIETVKETDALIDDLPGLDKTEDEQMEELRRLQIQSEEEAQTLRQVAEEAGEDSEEDEDEEEEFQFGRPAAPAPVVVQQAIQPKFSVQAPVAGAEDDESDEEEGGDERQVPPSEGVEPAEGTYTPERTPRVSIDSSARSISRPTTPELPLSLHAGKPEAHRDAYDEEWVADGSVDGVAMMGCSIVQKLEPSLDSTIRRIAELTDIQQRLLMLLKDQRKEICSSDRIENVAIVMSKLPQYTKKVQDIKAAMSEISSSVNRMKKRSESLRVDAQSHAIKKENKRESQNQWNKLYAAKSFEGATMSAAISSSFSSPPPPPSSQ